MLGSALDWIDGKLRLLEAFDLSVVTSSPFFQGAVWFGEIGLYAAITTIAVNRLRISIEKRRLRNERLLAFSSILDRLYSDESGKLSEEINSVQDCMIKTIKIQYGLYDAILDRIRESGAESLSDEHQIANVLTEFFEKNDIEYIDVTSSLFSSIRAVENKISIVDDTIEAHVASLDFESAWVANDLRTQIRDLYRWMMDFSDSIGEMRSAFQSQQMKSLTRLVRDIDARIPVTDGTDLLSESHEAKDNPYAIFNAPRRDEVELEVRNAIDAGGKRVEKVAERMRTYIRLRQLPKPDVPVLKGSKVLVRFDDKSPRKLQIGP
ncbi:MAG: hypothetical protein RKE49_11480 [Oceanicaulis sp.]